MKNDKPSSEQELQQLDDEKKGKKGLFSKFNFGATKDEDKKDGKEAKPNIEELWNTVGYHRITGGVFYSYILLIGGAIVGLVAVGFVAEFLPYPEINGYKSIVASLLGFWFGLLDLNLGGGGSLSDSMGRFIGQYADTNPRRALEYIRFYIWFQMWTGIAQVTVIGFVAIYYLANSSFAYLIWFIIAQSLVQYPGMLMIMEDSLKAFQRGDKTAWLSWLQDTVFQVTVNIAFLIIGKWWGSQNPRIGELMGITIFYILSQFADDWINLAVGAKMFSSVLKKRGIEKGFMQLFIPRFHKGIVKECILFVGKQWIGSQILGIVGYFVNLYIIVRMPQMASWSGLLLIPNFLGHLVSMVNWGSPTVPAISESYNNGKTELAQYFIASMYRYWIFVVVFMAVPLAVLTPKLLNVVLKLQVLESGLANYQAGLVMIPLMMVISASGQWRGWYRKIFVACNDPMPPIYIDYIFTPTGYIFQFLFLYLTVDLGVMPVWLLLVVPAFLNDLMKATVGYIWLQRRVIKIPYKKMAWTVAIVPLLTSVAYAFTLWIFEIAIWPLLDLLFVGMLGEEIGKFTVAALILLAILFLFPAIFMAPYYSLFGGWDKFTLDEFKKTAQISGPSKGITMMLYKISAFFAYKSPWYDKYHLADYDLIKRQVKELIEEGKANALLGKK
ncbi:MAG: hypothetical protein ACTSVI_15015 [Promethearchaeota archaeon]